MTGPHEAQLRADVALLTRPFALLVLGHFLQAMGYASMLLLPLYLQFLGGSRAEIGAVMATAAASGLVIRPFVGLALDRFGRRPTLVVGTVILVAGMLLVGFVDDMGPVVYLGRAIFGVGMGALFAGYFTLAADVVPAERRTEGIALFGISGLLPLLVNPFAAEIGIAPADLRWFLPAVGGLAALSLVTPLLLAETAAKPTEPIRLSEVIAALRHRALWSVWLATSVFSAMVAVFMAFATVTAAQRGVERPATLWLAYAAGAVVVRLAGARLPDRIGPANLVAPAVAVYVLADWIAADAAILSEFLLAALLAGIGHGYGFPVLVSQVVSRSAVRVRGSGLAAFTALWGLSELWVSPALGLVADRHGDSAMFGLTGILAVGALALWLVLEHRAGVAPTGAIGREAATHRAGPP